MKINGLASMILAATFFGAAGAFAVPTSEDAAQAPVKSGGALAQFPKALPHPSRQISHASPNFDFKKEQFFIHVPPSYTGREPYGLIVYIAPSPAQTALPGGWDAVLDAKKLLFISPQDVGNSQPNERRNGLAAFSALAMMKYYNIDRNRVYSAGHSGGARVACDIAFYAPDLFKGTLQSCGTNFYKAVPQVAVTSADKAAHPEDYGVAPISRAEADAARLKVKFVMITGPNDWRYRYIQDIYNGGFLPGHYKAKLLDIPGMGHQVCGGEALQAALDFLSQP